MRHEENTEKKEVSKWILGLLVLRHSTTRSLESPLRGSTTSSDSTNTLKSMTHGIHENKLECVF